MNTDPGIAAAAAPAAPEPPAPRRWITRRTARRVGLLRDLLASIKDAGIIVLVLALLLFHDEVIDSLQGLAMLRGTDAVVNVQGSLQRLNRAADMQMPAALQAGASAPAPVLGGKVLRAESRLLRSEDAAYILDWIVVLPGGLDPAQAEARLAELRTLAPSATLVVKSGRLRLMIPAGTPEDAQALLNRVRPRHPAAVPTSLSAWCDPQPPGAGPAPVCRRV